MAASLASGTPEYGVPYCTKSGLGGFITGGSVTAGSFDLQLIRKLRTNIRIVRYEFELTDRSDFI